MLEFLKTCICCCIAGGLKAHEVKRGVEINETVRCCIDLKDCYDHCTSKVGVEDDTNSVQMTGVAPHDNAMA